MTFAAWATHGETNVTIVTTTETAILTLQCKGVKAGQTVIVWGWYNMELGANLTGWVNFIREGRGVSGDAIGDANTLTGVLGGNSVAESHMVTHVAEVDDPEYTFSVQQNGATGNGTVHLYGMFAMRVKHGEVGA